MSGAAESAGSAGSTDPLGEIGARPWALRPELNSLEHMRDAVFFDGPETKTRLSRFWLLLLLSSIIAAAGVVADSTATVIGAMIVAPLMLPIQGTMLATVLADRRNFTRSFLILIGGSASAIAVGFLVGLLAITPIVAATNDQVAQRVNPRLIDLLAALAVGAVGSIALIRRDISDTLPGVAVAISLVPPLTVVGLTLESGAPGQSAGALLLFVTNVAAILATGSIVMALYGVARIVRGGLDERTRRSRRRHAVVVTTVVAALVGVPLALASVSAITTTTQQGNLERVAMQWAQDNDWKYVGTEARDGVSYLQFEGGLDPGDASPNVPDTRSLERELSEAGIDPTTVQVLLVPTYVVDFGDSGGGSDGD
jgi:uncharacterized hydrophobic protein (TIGR00271 family)